MMVSFAVRLCLSWLTLIGEAIDPNRAFGENLERLRVLKKKYDPDNVFYKWHSLWATE